MHAQYSRQSWHETHLYLHFMGLNDNTHCFRSPTSVRNELVPNLSSRRGVLSRVLVTATTTAQSCPDHDESAGVSWFGRKEDGLAWVPLLKNALGLRVTRPLRNHVSVPSGVCLIKNADCYNNKVPPCTVMSDASRSMRSYCSSEKGVRWTLNEKLFANAPWTEQIIERFRI